MFPLVSGRLSMPICMGTSMAPPPTTTTTLAKIQATAIFRMEDMRRNVFTKFIEIGMETPC